MTTPGGARRADVELRLPADGAYASVLRTTTAGLAARLDFTIDDIEDLRIAASEASALVLPEADEGTDLLCRFWLDPGELVLSLTVSASTPTAPDEDGFAWQVLSTLASEVTSEVGAGSFTLRLTMRPESAATSG
jgi:serine/threonine-protein kinase RsbW